MPMDDPHMSEIPPTWYGRVEAITGFDGSAGTAVIFAQDKKKCAFATDGRYFLQVFPFPMEERLSINLFFSLVLSR